MPVMTPMMKQYMEVKQQNPDCLLFFRLGDFYEMFAEDARIASRELDLTLTSRDRSKSKDAEDRIPMCGVPYHSSDSYIARLVSKGYKVAICEQMEDPALAKGLVKREVIRVVTPGTVTESSMLDERKNNYFACALEEGGVWGLCFCDVSTGACYATVTTAEGAEEKAINEIGRFMPSEILLGGGARRSEQGIGPRVVRLIGRGQTLQLRRSAARARAVAEGAEVQIVARRAEADRVHDVRRCAVRIAEPQRGDVHSVERVRVAGTQNALGVASSLGSCARNAPHKAGFASARPCLYQMQKVALAAAKAAVKREKSASGICTEEAVYIQVPHLHAFYAAQDVRGARND